MHAVHSSSHVKGRVPAKRCILKGYPDIAILTSHHHANVQYEDLRGGMSILVSILLIIGMPAMNFGSSMDSCDPGWQRMCVAFDI
jgi:hypothetical protein